MIRIWYLLIALGAMSGCAGDRRSEVRIPVLRPPEVIVTVRHLDHGKPLSYRFESHDRNAPAITEQRFEITAPEEMKGKIISIKILSGYDAPLQSSEYFRLQIPRYLMEESGARQAAEARYGHVDGWNFAALVVDASSNQSPHPAR